MSGSEEDGDVGVGLGGSSEEDVMKESEAKKQKKPRRRRKKSEMNNNEDGIGKDSALTNVEKVEFVNVCREGRIAYSRKEMEAMRFVGVEEQKKTWVEVYCGLGTEIAKLYDGLIGSHRHKQEHFSLDFDPRRQFGCQKPPSIHDNEPGNVNSSGSYISEAIGDEKSCPIVEEECSNDDESDEEYDGILRPAFFVKGEPDFDSGPPQDGLEYLRRVRWEAAQIPKVKVAKVDNSKLNREQTAYMPQIPEIAKCPDHLLPLKKWEDDFLADFSQLRVALLHNPEELNGKQQTVIISHGEKSNPKLSDTIAETLDELTGGEDCSPSDASSLDHSGDEPAALAILGSNASDAPDSFICRQATKDNHRNYPTLSFIAGMEPVARVSMLRKRISSLENANSLSKDDCLWIFALCAAIDTPLDADTSASFRSLLRKCASLRSQKTELDDEVIMLNILATISGRYFGQSEDLRGA